MSDGPPLLNLAAISLGSNIHPVDNLPKAVREIQTLGKITKVSRVYESAPVGDTDQPNFLNAAVLLETSSSVEDLKRGALKSIEQKLGRIRDPNNKNAPRTIDLDLSIFITPTESCILDDDLLARAFVAIPLAEILPDFEHPRTHQKLTEIVQSVAMTSQHLHHRPDCDLSACLSPVL